MQQNTEIWPPPGSWSKPRWQSAYSLESLEQVFSDIFFGHPVVIFSSGRSAIVGILKAYNLSRPDLVFTLPYSSHCVLNALSFVGTPVTTFGANIPNALVYHQWGYPIKIPHTVSAIEDSVDSLITESSALFPNGGDYEIISLAKILGNRFGGIVICRSSEQASRLRESREKMLRIASTQSALRLLQPWLRGALHYWGDTEPLNGEVNAIMRKDIHGAIKNWPHLVRARSSQLHKALNETPPSILPTKGRIPTALIFESLDKIPVSWHSRLIERTKINCDGANFTEKKVFLLPIHIGSQI